MQHVWILAVGLVSYSLVVYKFTIFNNLAEHHYQILEPLQDVQDDSTCLDHGSRTSGLFFVCNLVINCLSLTVEHHYQILEPPTSNQDSSNLDDGNSMTEYHYFIFLLIIRNLLCS